MALPVGPSTPATRPPSDPHARRRSADGRAAAHARRFGDALRAADTRMAQEVIDRALAEGLSAAAIHSRVMTPALYRIGSLWEAGAITIADEHLATATCQRMLVSLYPSLQHGPTASPGRVLLAAVQDQHHALGLRMVADVLEGAGYDVLHLGADVPTEALLAAVEHHAPALVGLTLTMPLGIPRLEDVLHGLQAAKPDLPVLLGGQGVPTHLREAGWPYAGSTEGLLPLVASLIAEPGAMPHAPTPLELGFSAADRWDATRGIGTAEHRLGELVAEASDVARAYSRRARALQDAGLRDPLTDLANRRALDDRVDVGIASDEAVLLLDLDRFTRINETYGPAEGDLVLQHIGDLMRAALRIGDFAARHDADGFAVILSPCDAEHAATTAERLRRTTAAVLAEYGVTVSIGGAGGGAPDALARAARALLIAKQAGRNRVCFDV